MVMFSNQASESEIWAEVGGGLTFSAESKR